MLFFLSPRYIPDTFNNTVTTTRQINDSNFFFYKLRCLISSYHAKTDRLQRTILSYQTFCNNLCFVLTNFFFSQFHWRRRCFTIHIIDIWLTGWKYSFTGTRLSPTRLAVCIVIIILIIDEPSKVHQRCQCIFGNITWHV